MLTNEERNEVFDTINNINYTIDENKLESDIRTAGGINDIQYRIVDAAAHALGLGGIEGAANTTRGWFGMGGSNGEISNTDRLNNMIAEEQSAAAINFTMPQLDMPEGMSNSETTINNDNSTFSPNVTINISNNGAAGSTTENAVQQQLEDIYLNSIMRGY